MAGYTLEELTYIIQFNHLEKQHADLPGVSEQAVAPLFGVSAEVYRGILDGFAEHACRAAQELLEEPGFAACVDRLPFRAGAVVAAAGDSITDDLQSWAEILRHVLALRRPGDRLRVINTAISGDTTTHLITRFSGVVQERPDWILCMIGTNDARRHGLQPIWPLVCPEESARNLEVLRHFAATQSAARWVWIAPPQVIEEKIPAHWYLGPMQISWSNRDLAAVAEVVRRQPGLVVDLQPAFGRPPDPALLLDDGLHPSLAGQKAILRALVQGLGDNQADKT
jgi:lysophospholipase L1-like esterase